MAKENAAVVKIHTVEKDITGLQHSVRTLNEQLNQAVEMIGQMRISAERDNANIQRLQLEMEKVYSYINQKGLPR